jgi:hypothetical protein
VSFKGSSELGNKDADGESRVVQFLFFSFCGIIASLPLCCMLPDCCNLSLHTFGRETSYYYQPSMLRKHPGPLQLGHFSILDRDVIDEDTSFDICLVQRDLQVGAYSSEVRR